MLDALPPTEAAHAEFVICDCAIENGLHYRRDVSLDEDYSQVRMGQAPHVLATLNNIVVGLAAHHEQANLPAAQRAFHYRLERALWTSSLS